MSRDADVYYIDHDDVVQQQPITRGRMDHLEIKFAVQMSDGTVRAYASAQQVGGARSVEYLINETGAVRVTWNTGRGEWLAPGTWKLIRDGWSFEDLIEAG